jgi:hypothetical protein
MKHLLTTAVLLAVTAVAIGGTAEAKSQNRKSQAKGQTDLMMVRLEGDDNNWHQQAAAHESCLMLINQLTDGRQIMLTMRNPYIKGKVLEALCILPDGSRIDWPVS